MCLISVWYACDDKESAEWLNVNNTGHSEKLMWTTWQEINHKLPNAAVTCVTSAAGPRDGWRCRLQETHLLHNNPSQPIQPITVHSTPSQHIYSCKDPQTKSLSHHISFLFSRLSRGPVKTSPRPESKVESRVRIVCSSCRDKNRSPWAILAGYCKATQVGLWRRKGKMLNGRDAARLGGHRLCFSLSSSFWW